MSDSMMRNEQEGIPIEKGLELLRNHNPVALEFLTQYAPLMERVLARKFKDIAALNEIEDIVCQGIMRAFRTGERYSEDIGRIETWLITLAHWEAIDFLRGRNYLDTQSFDELIYNIAVESVADDTTINDVPSKDIEDVLQLLRPRASDIIREFYYKGLTLEEMGEKYQIKPASVKVAISRALADMRERMSH
jgi:RNA polymerase sigma factor (sigma-70 family)